jgi:thiol:disulfide interchange protein DsbD
MKFQSLAPSRLLSAALGLLFLVTAPTVRAEPVRTGHLELELIAEGPAEPGKTVVVGLRQTIAPGWHTYWKNPGDAGEPTTLDWTLPKGWSASEILWPVPERAMTGPLMNYVYSDKVVLPVRLKVPADAARGTRVSLAAHASLLVCKDVCVPEEANLTLQLPIGGGAGSDNPGKALINAALAQRPTPLKAKAAFRLAGDRIILTIASDALAAKARSAGLSSLYFYPESGTVIDHAKPQAAEVRDGALVVSLPAGYDPQHGKAPASLDGVLALGHGAGFAISAVAQGAAPTDAPAPTVAARAEPVPAEAGKTEAAPPAASAPTKAVAAALPPVAPPIAPPVADDGARLNLASAALFAFVGGLILNLMPCVFPVLSIKAAALARHTEHPGEARREGLAYLAGAVASFLVLALLLITARRAGQAVGWGFQLQDPLTVGLLALVMLGSALNLSGLFEMGLSVQGAGGGLTTRPGAVGAFFTGVLAVVVAAPCTGPFMATTIGWALAQPDPQALTVFAFLGAGLASPFVALAFAPGLARIMPRPGPWMNWLRKVLAFPMYGAAAWLAWVFAEQTSAHGLPWLFAAAVLAAFGLWLWGAGQQAERDGPRRLLHGIGAASAIAAVAVLVAAPLRIAAPVAAEATGDGAWSEARVAALQAAGKPVFVDFTAAWCVTCKVNEAGALASPGVKAAFARTGAVYLKADWTRRDATIAQVLQRFGRAGVPLYLVYPRHGGAPQILPQLLTEADVAGALDSAAR